MDIDNIRKNELLFRAINIQPWFWDNDINKPSTAAFKDKKGLSVDRDGNRKVKDIIESFEKRFNLKALISIKSEICFNLNLKVIPKPSKKNIYHAEIHQENEDKNDKSISKKNARELSKICKLIKLY
jgi:hypothetical protein